jgi:hypothetical protein
VRVALCNLADRVPVVVCVFTTYMNFLVNLGLLETVAHSVESTMVPVWELDKTVKLIPLVLQAIFARPVIFATTSMLDFVFLMPRVCEVVSPARAWSCAACSISDS